MFIGEYKHSVDAKGRVAIPAKFRLQLEEGAIVVRWVGGQAAIFPRPAFEALAERLKSLPLANEQARDVSAFLFSSAFELEKDGQGRVVLPAAIRDWAGLGNEAVIVGAGERVDIWAPDRWAAKGFASPAAFASAFNSLEL